MEAQAHGQPNQERVWELGLTHSAAGRGLYPSLHPDYRYSEGLGRTQKGSSLGQVLLRRAFTDLQGLRGKPQMGLERRGA